MKTKYDFSGYATRNDLLCADGRTIRAGAFSDCDGITVPIVYGHDHQSIDQVLGHGLLREVEDGVRVYGKFNNTPAGRSAKEAVQNGDLKYLSIYANKLKQNGKDVIHGMIREVSLVLAGANPGAYIDYPVLAHTEEPVYDEAIIYLSDNDTIELYHSADGADDEDDEDYLDVDDVFETLTEEQKNVVYGLIAAAIARNNELEHADDDGEEFGMGEERTYDDVLDTLNDEQLEAVSALLDAVEDEYEGYDDGDYDEYDDDYDEYDDDIEHGYYDEGDYMKHNLFDNDYYGDDVLSHSESESIIELAKNGNVGTLQNAISLYEEENDCVLQHDDLAPSSGFVQNPNTSGNVSWLFPEYKDVRPGAPELVTYDQGWVTAALAKVHKSPISRIRTGQVDIRNIDELRAKGYDKGKKKALTGNFQLVRRTTDPTTVYVKSALHRDDIVDITDFSYVDYLYNIDKLQLNEELARAILFGDGRGEGVEGKIDETKIRPIWTDDELYTIHYDIDVDGTKATLQGTETDSYFGDSYVRAEAMINACLYSREQYKGSGQPDMFIAPHELNVMLLARDRNGRRIYSSKAELSAAFNVGNIYTIEQMGGNGLTRTDGEGASAKTKKLLCLMVNLTDYSLGATKGGEITHFTQFDIDFNQEKSLLETRCSGALTRIKSAIAVEEDITA